MPLRFPGNFKSRSERMCPSKRFSKKQALRDLCITPFHSLFSVIVQPVLSFRTNVSDQAQTGPSSGDIFEPVSRQGGPFGRNDRK